jgi:hypothetical protein
MLENEYEQVLRDAGVLDELSDFNRNIGSPASRHRGQVRGRTVWRVYRWKVKALLFNVELICLACLILEEGIQSSSSAWA